MSTREPFAPASGKDFTTPPPPTTTQTQLGRRSESGDTEPPPRPGTDLPPRDPTIPGSGFVQIPHDAVIWTDPSTGHGWTYEEVLAQDRLNPFFGFDANNPDRFGQPTPIYLRTDLTWFDWQGTGQNGNFGLAGPGNMGAGVIAGLKQIAPPTRRGSGGGGATFVAADPDEVRESVKNYVVATTGTVNEALIDEGVKVFQSKNKEAFASRKTQEISPWQAVKEHVRQSQTYKTIHNLRPESVDELEWVTSRQAKFRQLGISDTRAEQLGITSATVGSSDEALIGQAELGQQQGTGRLLKTQTEALKRSASAALGLI